jgi:hypothetical protein
VSKKPTTSSTPRKGRKSEPTQDESFRRWLEQQLHKKYDAVLEEPVPDELLSLLRPEDPQK